MHDDRTVALAGGLAQVADRQRAAAALAEELGASGLLILVEDPVVGAFVPAPGFPQTLPGGPTWRELLRRARVPGDYATELGYPTTATRTPAVARSAAGLLVILFGTPSRPVFSDALDRLDPVAPLLAAMLRAEQAELAARGELRVAQHHARDAELLARALDAARTEVEGTLRRSEQQARALDDARARAEQATRAKDEFLAMLGHELRNPLSPILTALQLMRLKGQSSREQDVIERQVAGLTQLVDDLLDVSRITRGKVELRPERVELAAVAARAIELASPMLEKKRQVLTVDIAPSGLAVDGDPTRLAQVFANLLTNASKYSEEDRRVVFAARAEGGRIVARVQDEGIGLAPDMLPRIFDQFVQHQQALDRSQGGLGLGLAIVRSLVELHGGTVEAHSRGEGYGSEFVVSLPRAAAPAEAGAAVPRVQELPHRSHAGERVLIVDDNDDALLMLSEALRSLEFDVRTAADGPTALRVAEEFRPQLALLDLGLPVMDGFELAQRLRERVGAPLRLVAISGYGQPEDRVRSSAAGFQAHLVKPVALEELVRVLDRLSAPRS